MKHISGPWHYADNENVGDMQAVYAPDGEVIAEYINNRADVHLIAAAPELLDELESLVRRLKAHYPGFETTSARTAIAKAKGEI